MFPWPVRRYGRSYASLAFLGVDPTNPPDPFAPLSEMPVEAVRCVHCGELRFSSIRAATLFARGPT